MLSKHIRRDSNSAIPCINIIGESNHAILHTHVPRFFLAQDTGPSQLAGQESRMRMRMRITIKSTKKTMNM